MTVPFFNGHLLRHRGRADRNGARREKFVRGSAL
jgi:hypothetical protein